MSAHLVVLAGPSGVGKSSVIREALAEDPTTWLSVSATTRAPRPGEEHGVNYFFVSDEQFDEAISVDIQRDQRIRFAPGEVAYVDHRHPAGQCAGAFDAHPVRLHVEQ